MDFDCVKLPGTVISTGVAQVALGYGHTCAVLSDGTLKCWGWNNAGQLGDGSTTNRATPTATTALGSAVVQLSLGLSHTCAVLTGGVLKCWGMNMNGQLGIASTADCLMMSSNNCVTSAAAGTVDPPTGRTFKQVAAGGESTCAVLDNDALWCWGKNSYGELGFASTGTQTGTGACSPFGCETSPKVVYDGSGSNKVKQVALGNQRTCAVLADGRGRGETARPCRPTPR